jgi:phosphoribosylaminoimidazole (AIR) synthetase
MTDDTHTLQTPHQEHLQKLFDELEEARRVYVRLANAYFAKSPVKHQMHIAEVDLMRKLGAWLEEKARLVGTPA